MHRMVLSVFDLPSVAMYDASYVHYAELMAQVFGDEDISALYRLKNQPDR